MRNGSLVAASTRVSSALDTSEMDSSSSSSSLTPSRVIEEWLAVSQLLQWFVVVTAAVTLPILLLTLAYLRRKRKSQYFPFLFAIVLGNFVQLFFIVTVLVLKELPSDVPGSIGCKLTNFIANVGACFCHWCWVGMYIQRCCYIFSPTQSLDPTRFPWTILCSARRMLLLTFCMAVATQLWTPILVTEKEHENGTAFCGPDENIISSAATFQAIAIMESTFTFFIPFLLTVITDISVFFWNHPCQRQFALISVESLKKPTRHLVHHNDTHSVYLKIMSEKCILSSQRRRHFAISRCLLMATFNLSLNLPNFLVQLIDEFFHLRFGASDAEQLFYIKMDAMAYMLYLLQFPMVPFYVYLLRNDLDPHCRRSPRSLLGEDVTDVLCRARGSLPRFSIHSGHQTAEMRTLSAETNCSRSP